MSEFKDITLTGHLASLPGYQPKDYEIRARVVVKWRDIDAKVDVYQTEKGNLVFHHDFQGDEKWTLVVFPSLERAAELTENGDAVFDRELIQSVRERLQPVYPKERLDI